MNRPDYNERIEIVQDVIDRLLYLPEEDLNKFMRGLDALGVKFPLNYYKVQGVRTYKQLS